MTVSKEEGMDNGYELTREKLIELDTAVRECSQLLVLTHDNPDPDALASAEALRYLLQQRCGVRVRAAYGGIIGRAENQTMIKVLDLRISLIDNLKLSSYSTFALVDTQPKAGNNSLPPYITADIVIDHHPRRRGQTGLFVDTREHYGATSTILTEYLVQSGLEIPANLATALFYGIASDTQFLGRQATDADVRASMILFPLANMRRLSKIEYPPLPQSYYVNIDRALENAFVFKNIIGSRVGVVDNPDIIPEFADLLLRHEKATWAVCMGCWKGSLIVSIRTSNPRADAGRLVRRLVGKKGRAGGHGMMAAGKIPCPTGDPQAMSAMEEKLIRKFLRLLGKKESAVLEPLLEPDLNPPPPRSGSSAVVS